MNLFVSIFLVFVLNTGNAFPQIVKDQLNSRQTTAHTPEYIECPNSEFCSNGGTCYMEVNKKFPLYLCKCPDKYYGETCQFIRTDQAKCCPPELADHFCVNGGTCYEDRAMNETVYHCRCPEKFWGARCESISPGKIQLCPPMVGQILCKNEGTCYETSMGDERYEFCVCTNEYIGPDCGFKVVEDNSTVLLNELLCLNEGVCNRVIWQDVEIFGCSCQQGFYGDRCEYVTSETSSLCSTKDSDFCFNAGTCYQEVFGSKKVFFCSCRTGYTGQRCEISLSTEPHACQYLEDKFCANGGTCLEARYLEVTLRYCECTYQFAGTRCEKKLPRERTCPPPLDKETCENNGTCLSIDTGGKQGAYMCKCAEGYYGATCEYRQLAFLPMRSECPEEILEFLCQNGGTCYKDIIMNRPFYYCECVKPFHGVRCEKEMTMWTPCPPPLDTQLCLRGGICSQVATHFSSLYFCQCKEGTFGARCEHCALGIIIEDHPCPTPLDKVLCKNGGSCVKVRLNSLISTFFCSCPEGLYGMSCEYPYSTLAIKDACPLDMEKTFCLNGGTCYKEKITGYTVYACECVYPYTGERCELLSIQKSNCPQEFNNVLCLNSGSCTYRKSNGYDIYFCECAEGHFGARCEHTFKPVTDCPQGFKDKLCKNGGICFTAKLYQTSLSIYYCQCVGGFFGVLCEYPHSSIESKTVLCPGDIADKYCEHGGTCYTSRLTGKPVYYCLCPDGYHGITCEFAYPSTKCSQDMAQHLCVHGSCLQRQSNGVDTYQCVCHQGFYGDRCEHELKEFTCTPPFSTDLCKNNGTCVRLTPLTQQAINLHYCKCPQGFYGTACEYPYHPALDKLEPCRLDVAQSYCLNGGTCYRREIEGQSAYFCDCVVPYYGARCEYNLPLRTQCIFPISKLLCVQGHCTQHIVNGQTIYSCLCMEGFYGTRCEHKQKDISHYEPCPHPLENNLCGNGGSCIATVFKEDRDLYFCKCREEYYGISCEYMKPKLPGKYCPAEIARDWCLHGGTCFVERMMNRLVYRCECASPFYGERCEMHAFIQLYCPSSMQKNLCYNGGSCISITIGRYEVYYCKCAKHYYGSRCEYCKDLIKEGVCPSHLNTDLCKNGGTCIIVKGPRGENIYYCKCPEGLYGLSCEYPYPHLATVGRPCPACIAENYCLHGGKCYREDIMGNSVYRCDCVYPYHGERCEVRHPEQLNCPNQFHYFLCLNNGTCVQSESNGHTIYICICEDGYYGPRCEHTCGEVEDPAKLCEDPFNRELCKNGGTCVSLKFPGGSELLFCKCRPGLFGTGCEYPFLPISHESTVCPPFVADYFCLNGGTCYKDIDADDIFYYCMCPDTYFGDRCELNFPEQLNCPNLPFEMELCLNGGTCVQLQTYGHHIYLCQCAEGYYGPRCEYSTHYTTCPSPIDEVLCMNGGTCTVLTTVKDQHLYFCICPEGYYGMICEHTIPPSSVGEHCPLALAENWCLNGGTCYQDSVMGVTIYYCRCVEPFYGERCEIESPEQLPCPQVLAKFLCINGGVCTKRILHRHTSALYYCDCPIGYSGARCEMTTLIERKVKYCAAHKWFCLNGGVCLQEVVGGILHCDCKHGYYGERCQLKQRGPIACPPEYQGHICFNGGTCMIGSTLLRKTAYCECQAGYLGQQCEFTEPKIKPSCPNEVNEILCLNGGTCLEETIGKQRLYYCECTEPYFGWRCEYDSPKGDTCEVSLATHFCLNGGTCYSFKFSGHIIYYCACETGYHGSLCQYPMQEPVTETLCSPEIAEWFCYNGGTCFQDTVNNNVDYYCICLKGFAGHRCEYIEDNSISCSIPEQPVFCKNHGTCKRVIDTFTDTYYYCLCPEGYGGRRCDYVNHRIDKCPVSLEMSLCLNDGKCRVLIFIGHIIYYCECPLGFYGPRCQDTFPSPIQEKTCPENIDQHFCLNGGTCRQTFSQKLVINYCICVEGFWGERCEYSYSDQTNCSQAFDQFYCLNGGTCYQLTVGKEIFYHCECLRNFFGSRCESQHPVDGPGSERCVGEIDSYFCLNNGTCYQTVVNNEVFYHCKCPEGWTGLRCEDGPVTKQNCPSELAEEYCLNNGTCVKLQVGIQELYYCRCARGFEGTRCEYNLPNSVSNPCSAVLSEMYCLNSGTCSQMTVLDETFYMCDCPERYWGKQCEFSSFIRNFCPPVLDTSFCLNGGTCYQVLVDDKDLYYCVCTNIYYGMRCENSYLVSHESQPCHPKISTEICLNGGSCYEIYERGKRYERGHKIFYCECAEGYSGKRCEHENVGYLHISYLNMQHNLERSCSSVQDDICFFLLLLLWFTCYKTIF